MLFKNLAILVAITTLASLSSCQRCTECTSKRDVVYQYKIPDSPLPLSYSSSNPVTEEECGTKQDIRDFKSEVEVENDDWQTSTTLGLLAIKTLLEDQFGNEIDFSYTVTSDFFCKNKLN